MAKRDDIWGDGGNCTQCKAYQPFGKHCTKCGTVLIDTTCEHCGRMVLEHYIFCSGCGRKVEKGVTCGVGK